MKDPDTAYDQHRQDCVDEGVCHFCEGEGCPRCYVRLAIQHNALIDEYMNMREHALAMVDFVDLLKEEYHPSCGCDVCKLLDEFKQSVERQRK